MASSWVEEKREWEFYALMRRLMQFNSQHPPIKNDGPEVWPIVIEDMKKRNEFGRQKYGVGLQANNGRDALVDAYEEVLDLAVYLRQTIIERDGK